MEHINERLNEFIAYIKGRKIAIIGLESNSLSIIDFFRSKGATLSIFDSKTIENIDKKTLDKITEYSLEFSFGRNYLSKLKNFDIIIKSPKIPPNIQEIILEEERGALVTTESELLLKMCPCKTIGVTGTYGKTTTVTLIFEILKAGNYNCYTNIDNNTSLFSKIQDIRPDDIVILKLNSFDLSEMQVSPNIGIITNIMLEDSNRNEDIEEYKKAKKNILNYQDKDDILIINYDNDIIRELAISAKGKIIFFSSKNKLDNGYIIDEGIIKQCEDKLRKHILNTEDINFKGIHNQENICAAIAATASLVKIDTAINAIINFKGVEHRIEYIKKINKVKWYNDSAGINPMRTITALNAFAKDVVLICGGYDSGYDYTFLGKSITHKVKTLILIGQTAGKIFEVVKSESIIQDKNIDIYMCNNLNQAVILAKRYSCENECVLFSPASQSLDEFNNYQDRGNQFKNIVNKI